MPASYAHYTFGSNVLSKLDNIQVKQLLLAQHPLFDIGLHGPDILFYYKPITSNHVTKTGYGLHKKIAGDFFHHARTVIQHAEDQDAATAYILGFICHYVLDSECHGYVNQMAAKLNVSHTKIESEFERFLLERKRLDPIKTRTTDHIQSDLNWAKCISPFFHKISVDETKHALTSFKFYSNVLLAPRMWQRALINLILKVSGHYDFMHGLMISYKPEPKCDKTNEELLRRYRDAVPVAVTLINEYLSALTTDIPLSNRFQRNFE